MATPQVQVNKPKQKFVNRNKPVAGQDTINGVLTTLKDAREDAQVTAMDALGRNDRAGVLTTMRIDGTYQRAISSLEKAVLRAQWVRLTKDQKAAFTADGTLPEGIELIELEDEDEDGEDAEDAS